MHRIAAVLSNKCPTFLPEFYENIDMILDCPLLDFQEYIFST